LIETETIDSVCPSLVRSKLARKKVKLEASICGKSHAKRFARSGDAILA